MPASAPTFYLGTHQPHWLALTSCQQSDQPDTRRHRQRGRNLDHAMRALLAEPQGVRPHHGAVPTESVLVQAASNPDWVLA